MLSHCYWLWDPKPLNDSVVGLKILLHRRLYPEWLTDVFFWISINEIIDAVSLGHRLETLLGGNTLLKGGQLVREEIRSQGWIRRSWRNIQHRWEKLFTGQAKYLWHRYTMLGIYRSVAKNWKKDHMIQTQQTVKGFSGLLGNQSPREPHDHSELHHHQEKLFISRDNEIAQG